MNGDTPHIVRGGQADYKRLYYSNPDQALKKDVSLVAGFGVIPQGTGLAKVTAGTNKGKFVPYNPATISSAVKNTGQAYLVQDVVQGTDLYVTMADSYKFAVGDSVYVADNNTKTSSAEAGGLITAIDRTTYTHMAVITVTNTINANFTVAQSACVFHIAGADNSNTWSDCAGILELAVDTGVGEFAKGGDGTMILSNAMLYNGLLTNIDSAARSDISASVDGQYLIMK